MLSFTTSRPNMPFDINTISLFTHQLLKKKSSMKARRLLLSDFYYQKLLNKNFRLSHVQLQNTA